MVTYDRSASTDAAVVLDWEAGISWIAHPHEDSQRASHAIRTDEGVWIIDPLDAPNVDDLLDPLGEVGGVAVLSSWHARDAGTFARRHGVAVHVPEWMDRIEELVDVPIERYGLAPGGSGAKSGFHTIPCRPFPRWQEAFLYHEPTETLVAPDSLGTTDIHLLDDERLGVTSFRRLQPPRQLGGLEPERILVGHGEPISEDATEALHAAVQNTRRTFPEMLRQNGSDSVRALIGAVLD
jgi:hypothetical protein